MDKYIVINYYNLDLFIQGVNRHIKLGYKPNGGMIIDEKGYFYQAMILNGSCDY